MTKLTKEELVEIMVEKCFNPNEPAQELESVNEILTDIANGDDSWTVEEAARFAWNEMTCDWLEELYSNDEEYSQTGIDFSEIEEEVAKEVIEKYISDFEDEVEDMREDNEYKGD